MGVAMAVSGNRTQPTLFQVCNDCLLTMTSVADMASMDPAPTPDIDIRVNYYGPNWADIRAAILQRDGNTCQDEGHKRAGGSDHRDKLVVHHIKPLKEFNGDHEAANQGTNLITLCTLCHGRWHSRLYHEAKAARAQQQ